MPIEQMLFSSQLQTEPSSTPSQPARSLAQALRYFCGPMQILVLAGLSGQENCRGELNPTNCPTTRFWRHDDHR